MKGSTGTSQLHLKSRSYFAKRSSTTNEVKKKGITTSNENYSCFGHNAKKMMELIGGGDQAEQKLGGNEWENLYSLCSVVMQQRRVLPEGGVSGKNKTQKATEAMILSEPKSTSIVDNSSRTLSEISTRNNKGNNAQAAYNTKAEQDKSKIDAASIEMVVAAVHHLSKTQQIYLVNVLDKMFSDLSFDEDSVNSNSKSIANSSISTHNSIPDIRDSREGSSRRRISGKYGRTISNMVDEATAILKKIGVAMDTPAFKKLNYDLTGRGPPILVGPTALRERLSSLISIQLTTREVTILMKKFDGECRGSVNLVDVLGNAQNQKVKSRKGTKKSSNVKSVVSDTKSVDSTSSKKKSGLPTALNPEDVKGLQSKLAQFAMEAIQSNSIKALDVSKPMLTPREFRQLLAQLEVGLNEAEFNLLESRYSNHEKSLLDLPSFRSEFRALGEDALQEARQTEARAAFIRVLSRNGKPSMDDMHSESSSVPRLSLVSSISGSDNITGEQTDMPPRTICSTPRSSVKKGHRDSIGDMDSMSMASNHFLAASDVSFHASVKSSVTSSSYRSRSSQSRSALAKAEISDDVLLSAEILRTEMSSKPSASKTSKHLQSTSNAKAGSKCDTDSASVDAYGQHLDHESAYEAVVYYEESLDSLSCCSQESKSEFYQNDSKEEESSTTSLRSRKKNKLRARSEGSSLSVTSGLEAEEHQSARSIATSGSRSRRQSSMARATRGLLPERVTKPISFKPQPKHVIPEWRSDGLHEDVMGDLELMSSYPSEWEEEEEEEEAWMQQREMAMTYGDAQEEEDEDGDDGDDDGKSEEDDNKSSVSYSSDSRAARVEEVLRLAEDILRMSSQPGLARERGVPLNESRDDEEEDDLMQEEEEEDDFEQEEDDDDDGYEGSQQSGRGRYVDEEMKDGRDRDRDTDHVYSNDTDENESPDSSHASAHRLWVLEKNALEGGTDDDAVSRLRPRLEYSNNQEEDQKDELRVKNQFGNDPVRRQRQDADADDDDEAYESDESAF